ncbi:phenylacetate--CoA ligase family protein [Exiguobacterium sp. RIT341]|uniref:phenylacetate--CoA ligase family protein n=1 Tax=Exiguobacterium sp. RIT341 TaxID=1470592 RepID=UPI00044BA46A|nr:phenylacetate--CoA ligase [Exiguobacterium sp. RIT341]EZP59171.1 Phenylacetate-CoA ligase [Exiguobacterium sp. RIT341]
MYDQHHETMDAQTREQLQMERLRQTMEHVTRVPFYQERLQTLQMTANDFQTIEDLRKFPFTRKQDLRDHYPFGLFAVEREEVTRIHASSGTSGKPTVVGYTQEDLDDWAGAVARSLVLAGGSPADLLHNAYGYGLFTGGLGLHAGAEKLGMTILPISGGNTDRQITLIEDFRPDGICGTPSYILRLAERMIERGIDPRKTSMRYGIFGAEPWSEEMRQTLEQTFDLQAFDIYGLSEIMGPGVAMECQEQAGLHIMDDLFITEVVDPVTGEPLPDGMVGELVFTSLKKKALPIIRYRTGDLASITRKVCACGRTTTRMSRVKGRTDDMLIIRGVNVFPSEIERVLLQQPDVTPHYQIHLVRKAGLDAVELHIEFENISERQMRSICDAIKSECLISIDLVCHPHQGLPRSEGKAVRVVDRRSTSLV